MALDPSYRAVCFDMDGTLLDTVVDYDRLASVVPDILEEMGARPLPRLPGETETGWGERTLRECGRSGDAERLQGLADGRRTAIEMENIGMAKPFGGVREALAALRAAGYAMGVLTRGGRLYAESALGSAGLLEMIDALVARDDFPECEMKPSPKSMGNMAAALGLSPAEILYLGDSRADMLAANGSGAGFRGVLTGRCDRAAWAAAGEARVVDGVASLLGMI
ncbi:MAG: HAD hydrolase-like protein [Candidatus Methanoplasma sp.]|jgi:phosphoglycolate phosphatase-like HAD superfamily hydrolase|nr:HAD hydrolase-like protein [Candidatus Methanoplasma sp.]